MPMLVIGLTGGIGSGKSTVADLFAQHGVTIIDMDQLSRQLTQPGTPGLAAIISHFGKDLLQSDGTLDRPALRKRIFANTAERIWLEQLLHPMIWEATEQQVKASHTPYCIVVIPLLTEFAPHPLIQRVLVVDATPAQQLQRTQQRDQQAAGHVPSILKTQSTRERRLQLADDIIRNDDSPEALATAVTALHHMYLQLAKK